MPGSLASVGWPVIDRFRIGDFAISPHGIGIAIGFMVGAWLLTKLTVRRGLPVEAANSVVFWSLIGAVVGARVAYVIAHASDFESPLEWFQIWNGGISLLGGIAGATIANAVNIKRQAYRFRFFQIADAVAPCLALGISVGRIGDLIIGDHLGKPTSWLLAWTYEGGTLAPPFSCVGDSCAANLQDSFTQTIDRTQAVLRDGTEVVARGIGVHQTAMYDMLLAGLLFAFLWWFIRSPRREGVTALVFATLLRVHPPAGGLAAYRQALRSVHRLAMDGAHRRDRVRRVPDLLGGEEAARTPRRPAAENPFPRAPRRRTRPPRRA